MLNSAEVVGPEVSGGERLKSLVSIGKIRSGDGEETKKDGLD